MPLEARLVVTERVAPEGEVEALAEADMMRVAAELRELSGGDGPIGACWALAGGWEDPARRGGRARVESVAACLLFSFLDPSHERALADVLRASCPVCMFPSPVRCCPSSGNTSGSALRLLTPA